MRVDPFGTAARADVRERRAAALTLLPPSPHIHVAPRTSRGVGKHLLRKVPSDFLGRLRPHPLPRVVDSIFHSRFSMNFAIFRRHFNEN